MRPAEAPSAGSIELLNGWPAKERVRVVFDDKSAAHCKTGDTLKSLPEPPKTTTCPHNNALSGAFQWPATAIKRAACERKLVFSKINSQRLNFHELPQSQTGRSHKVYDAAELWATSPMSG